MHDRVLTGCKAACGREKALDSQSLTNGHKPSASQGRQTFHALFSIEPMSVPQSTLPSRTVADLHQDLAKDSIRTSLPVSALLFPIIHSGNFTLLPHKKVRPKPPGPITMPGGSSRTNHLTKNAGMAQHHHHHSQSRPVTAWSSLSPSASRCPLRSIPCVPWWWSCRWHPCPLAD